MCKRMRQRLSLDVWQRESALHNAFPPLPAFLCRRFAVQRGQEGTHTPCILKPQKEGEGRP